ncbi:MAG TPA: TolC family protein [Bryobacteraceae bacterium]|nr:TolC family protein [Bryobacteraceae bacterium]
MNKPAAIGAVLLVTICAALRSQPAQPEAPLNISQAVDLALRNYPSIRVTQEQMNAAAAGIRLAQTAYLPRIDALAQVNRATRNTFFGLLLPQSVIANVDGVPANDFGTVWDSGAGILVTWQPFDFGLRAANVAAAAAAREHAQATVNSTRYDVSVATADAFLTLVAAEQTAQAAQAAVDSWQVLLRTIHAQVAAQLRPGADESRVQAELAAAQTQLAQADQAIDVARANLQQFTGSPASLNVVAGKLVDRLPPDRAEAPLQPSANPLAREQNAAVAQAQSQLSALTRTYYPQFSLQGVASARGTGLVSNGARLGWLNGLAPTTQNYGLGLTITFPVMDKFSIQEQEAIQSANVRAGQAQYQVVTTNLQARFNAALATFTGARRVAESTPVEVSSARVALQQATARYQSGLAPIDDVAQAQRLLVRAQIDDALARLNVWRARLQVETARGDIQPFVAEATQ